MARRQVAPAKGKLAVLMPGMGAVATTVIAGVEAVRQGRGRPIGSLTQMGTIRLGKRTERRTPLIKDFLPLAPIDKLVFGGWDIFPANAYESAVNARVLEKTLLDELKPSLEAIQPMKAVFDPEFVRRLDGENVKSRRLSKAEQAEALIDDIRRFQDQNDCDRAVMIWTASTEGYLEAGEVHSTLGRFEKGLMQNDPGIAPSQIYAYAALKAGVPFANGAPNLTVDFPAMQELAHKQELPICGKDFKTGQTLMKTILAPGLKARMLGIQGWYSTNILGNRDGEVLDDPANFKTKEVSKLGVLEHILHPKLNPELYGSLYHKVAINYYPPRGDAKEGWDNIDIFGFLGYPMQIKVNFLCRDSILAAPIVLDLALLMDLSRRAKMDGIQEWLSFYFKSPMVAEGLDPEHDLFIQLAKLKNTMRWMMGEELITHLGREYYKDT